jgi:hypothetical protein
MKRWLVLFTLLLSACATKVVDAPPNQPNPVELPPLDASVINIPLTIDLDAVKTEVLQRMPSPLVSATEKRMVKVGLGTMALPVEAKVAHEVWLRDLSMRMNGRQFVVTVDAEFSAEARVQAAGMGSSGVGCGKGEARPRIQFTLPGTVSWGPQGQILLSNGQWSLKWLTPCNLTALNIKAESILNLPLVRDKVEKLITDALNTATSGLSLRPHLARYWPELTAPRQIQPGIWLVLQPQKVGVADLSGQGRIVNTSVSVEARPQLISGNKPALAQAPIPAIEVLPRRDGFHLELRADVGLEEANRMLNQQLAGKPFDANGRTVLIEKLRLYGNGDKAVLGVTLKQPIEGEIYLLGKPVFDLEKNQLALTEVEYSLATSSWLASVADWMLGGSFREKIEEKARVKFDEDLAGTLKKLRDLRFDLGHGAVVRAGVERVRPRGIFFTQNDLKVLVLVDGKLAVDYGLSPQK